MNHYLEEICEELRVSPSFNLLFDSYVCSISNLAVVDPKYRNTTESNYPCILIYYNKLNGNSELPNEYSGFPVYYQQLDLSKITM